ncbi:CopG family transcriptional regulator [Iningainema tapete]|uniref:CopG family transcriptional regulator n=1 Tax=Iningainema tapete BLCC-T55 TaxID=2748662 RepID=A0A8J6XJX9_9CYAN|nr:CopG family transcriptional regulator [Iningainema tapete]MBD2778295.1 CopG family transcriptional regulator [Iningainema tapete BLCC-T55]
MQKVTVTLEDDILKFVDQQAQGNRSAYINSLLAEHRRSFLEAQMIAALKEDAQDPEYQAEIAAWDSVVGDGINAGE